jgi:hypothetical protein
MAAEKLPVWRCGTVAGALDPTDLEASRVTFLTVSHGDTIDRVAVVCGSKSTETAVLLGLSGSTSTLETKREPTGWTADDLKDTGIVVAPEGDADGVDEVG